MLNTRQKKIVDQMAKTEAWVKGNELATLTGVTTRTIRSDMDRINTLYPDLIRSSTREGYKINSKIYNEMNHQNNPEKKDLGPQTPQERSMYIIKMLLIKEEALKIVDLVDYLYVSTHTIESDVKRIREMIHSYEGLELSRSDNCIFLHGDEETKRRLYRRLLEEEIKGNFLNLNNIAELYQDFDLLKVITIFEEVLESYNYTLRKEVIPLITVHIGVTIERNLSQNFLSNKNTVCELAEQTEYEIVKSFFEEIAQFIPIEIREEEILGLATTMIGYRDSKTLQNEIIYKGLVKNIPHLIGDILCQIEAVFNLDFSKDEDFVNGLHLHIQSMVSRIENGITIPNVHHDEVKHSYPLIFEMGVHVAQIISEYFNFEILESEISFLALHMGAAYSRFLEQEKYKYRVLLIAPENDSFLKLTKSKITNMFKDRMEIVYISQYLVEEYIDEKRIDLIITTLPIQHTMSVSTVEISMFVGYEDESKIFRALNKLDKIKFAEEFSDQFGSLIDDRFYFPNLDFETPEEVIHYMASKLEEENIVSKKFKESVLERERIASTSFAYSVAIPHPLILDSYQSKIAVGILEKPMQWGTYQVRLVIMPILREKDSSKMWLFFDWLSETIMDSEKMTKLIESETKEEFVKLLTKN